MAAQLAAGAAVSLGLVMLAPGHVIAGVGNISVFICSVIVRHGALLMLVIGLCRRRLPPGRGRVMRNREERR